MTHHALMRLATTGIVAVTIAACQQQPGITPAPDAIPSVGPQAARGSPGSYELSFFNGTQSVSCLVVGGPELTLKAHVEDSAGVAATTGRVTFEYCSLQGLPPNDINRADEAPSSACDVDHTGRWTALGSVSVNQSGDARLFFGLVQIPRTIGFRLRFSAQGGTIASGTSPSRDFTWKTDCSL